MQRNIRRRKKLKVKFSNYIKWLEFYWKLYEKGIHSKITHVFFNHSGKRKRSQYKKRIYLMQKKSMKSIINSVFNVKQTNKTTD